MKHSHHNRTDRSLRVALVAALAGLCLQAGLAAGRDMTAPRLSQPVGEMAASDGVVGLRHSLETLARSMERGPGPQHGRRNMPRPPTPRPLSRDSEQPSGHGPSLRTIGALSKPNETAAGHPISSLYAQLALTQQRLPKSEDVGVDDLRRAMRRFDVTTEAAVSDTFSSVLLGLSDLMMPTLSDDPMAHPRVSTTDLREQIVDARLATSGREPALPAAGHRGPSLRVAKRNPGENTPGGEASADAPPSDVGGEIASLGGPVGELALSDMSAYPDRNGADSGVTEEQYAMDDELLLDEIGVDGNTIASLDSPVATDDLQETRAGFVLPNGVVIDLAVTRLTSVDGLDELHTVAQLPAGLDTKGLSQISVGRFSNTRVLSPGDGSLFTVIQNDMDYQRIRDVTTIDIGIKNLGVRARDFIPRSVIPIVDLQPPELRR